MSTNFWNKIFVDITQQCCALLPQVNFPANNLSFHWRWRWWDWIQSIFLNLSYFNYLICLHFVLCVIWMYFCKVDNLSLRFEVHHSMFLEWWNKTKSLSNIWQHACKNMQEIRSPQWLIDLRADQGRVPDWLDWLSYLAGSSKSHEISIFCIFLQSPHQVDMKNLVKWWKDFLLYFTTLKTYCGMWCFIDGSLTYRSFWLLVVFYD